MCRIIWSGKNHGSWRQAGVYQNPGLSTLADVNANSQHCSCLQVDYTPGSDQWNWLAYDLQVCSETGTIRLLFVLLASTCQGACWLLTWTALLLLGAGLIAFSAMGHARRTRQLCLVVVTQLLVSLLQQIDRTKTPWVIGKCQLAGQLCTGARCLHLVHFTVWSAQPAPI